ncbi:MAG: peptidylprolyl isomerase [Candidatus Acidiferrales bacterium]
MKLQFLVAGLALACGLAAAQTQSQQSQTQSQTKGQAQGQTQGQIGGQGATPVTGQSATTTAAAPPAAAQLHGKMIEEIVARVNNEIITSVKLKEAEDSAPSDAEQDCASRKCTPEELQKVTDDLRRDALRNLIDESLLVQRAKDMNLSVETDVIRQLDQIRIDHNLATLEDLEKAVAAEGENYDEFKDNIRRHLLISQVINREVYSRIGDTVDHAQIQKYYDEHKNDFQSPEMVVIREILVTTDGRPESDFPTLEKKATELRDRVLTGEDFGDLAKHFSDGSTAKQGGELGKFERGMLAKQIEDQVFKLNRKEMTPVIHAQNGFLVIQVEQRFEAGIQPLDKVQNEIIGRIAGKVAEPKLREYLDTLRRDSFVDVHPGYTDTAAVPGESITEINSNSLEPVSSKAPKPAKKHKRFILF